MNRRIAIEFIALLFLFLFMYAAVTKLTDYQKFAVQLGQSPMLAKWANIVAWLVPIVEIIISIALVFAVTQKAALYAALNLMVVFTAYIVIVTHYSPYVPCSCGGILERLGWTEHLFFNIGFICLAIVALLIYDQPAKDNTQSINSK